MATGNFVGQGWYWVWVSPCDQTPPTCGCFHRPPSWQCLMIFENKDIRYCGYSIPWEDMNCVVGDFIAQPDEPKDMGPDVNNHYVWKLST